jgi:hypothetical protein
MNLARDEAELTNPEVGGEAFELLCAYCRREWRDKRGNWHVEAATDCLALIEDAERKRRRAAGARDKKPGRDFLSAFDLAQARSKQRGHST